VGSNASSVDPDVVPSAVLQGLDIVTDGGSSLYGADAVAGVMNFRTMKKFDGVKVDGNYGFGTKITGYKDWDGAITAGKSWSSGNAYISVSHTERDSVLNSQTPWANGTVYSATGVPKVTSTTCNTPQQTVSRFFYVSSFGVWTNNTAFPGAGPVALGTGCDQILAGTYLPSLKRTNVFASVSNSFSDTIDLRITGYWMKREFGLPGYPLGYTSKAPTPVAPKGAPGTAGAPATSPFDFPQGVGFALGPNSSYVNTPQKIGIETWGITPELTLKLGSNWAVRTSVHYGRSDNSTHFPGLNTAQIDTYVTAGQIVPTNIAAASSAVIADITNWETAQDTQHALFDFKTVADGTIFSLLGNDAKLAVGAEYQSNTDATRINTGQLGILTTIPYKSVSRNVKSIFGELHIPVTRFVDLAASGRYDSYSDFGSTFNPNLGMTVKPTSWLKVYGHWGTSYNAPTPYDNLGIGLGRAGQNYTATTRPTVATGKSDNGQGTYFVVLTGASPAGLKPQTSDSWAVGFDAKPVRGLTFGAEFYSIDLRNAIGNLNPANAATYLTNPSGYIYNNELTANGGALYNQILGQLANGAAINTQVGGAANVAILVDTRTSNLNSAKVEGVDFHLAYETDTGFGHIAFVNTGTVATRGLQTNSGSTTNELGHGQPRFTLASSLALAHGPLSGKVTVNYSGKFHDNGTDYLGVSEDVNPFVVTNLNLGYKFGKSSGILPETSVSLKVDNLFDKSPQTIQRSNTNNPSFNNWTLGRVIKLGFSAKF
jgi:iron complex outermembrane receptor protein